MSKFNVECYTELTAFPFVRMLQALLELQNAVEELPGSDKPAAVKALKLQELASGVRKAIDLALAEENSQPHMTFFYENYRHEFEERRVVPLLLSYHVSKWHGDKPKWFLVAVDVDKNAIREFAMDGVGALEGVHLYGDTYNTAQELMNSLSLNGMKQRVLDWLQCRDIDDPEKALQNLHDELF